MEGVVDRLTRPDAEDQDRGLLDAYDEANDEPRGHVVGTNEAPDDSSDEGAK
ncbi:MAG: hypothetical protein ACRDLN_00525 [Solirubrobacteraceae bacterium]